MRVLAAGVLVAAAPLLLLGGCLGGDRVEKEAGSAEGPVATAGTTAFESVEPELRRGMAVVNGRHILMYWGDGTVFMRDGKRLAEAVVPEVGERFEFRGLMMGKELALTKVMLK